MIVTVVQDWKHRKQLEMMDRAFARPAHEVDAEIFRRGWGSASGPVLLLCKDNQEYVVKGSQAGRMIFNDHVVASLGVALGAPTGKPQIINVPAGLIAVEPQMAHMTPGLSHGTIWVADCTEAEGLRSTDVPENRSRFAALAVLYGWVAAGNEQFIYMKTPPNLVTSVDHGHFLPNGPDWTIATLAGAPPPQLNAYIAGTCNFTADELRPVYQRLRAVSDAHIGAIVGRPPASWNVSRDERIALADYLVTRRDLLIHTLAVP